jgi:hypothetical protein
VHSSPVQDFVQQLHYSQQTSCIAEQGAVIAKDDKTPHFVSTPPNYPLLQHAAALDHTSSISTWPWHGQQAARRTHCKNILHNLDGCLITELKIR